MGILVIILLATANTSDSLTPKSLDLINQIPTTPKDSWLAVDKFHHFSYSLCITGLSYHIYHCQFKDLIADATGIIVGAVLFTR
ncbi:MAG: hypothetical protein HY769_02150 [Candidatus Stahlbacteria bacterium]|nr:hypothetical protein [Candidatus Stahlbacteria bacterium]